MNCISDKYYLTAHFRWWVRLLLWMIQKIQTLEYVRMTIGRMALFLVQLIPYSSYTAYSAAQLQFCNFYFCH